MKGQFWTYLIKRLCLGVFTLFVILLASYIMMRLSPGNPAKTQGLSADGGGKNAVGTMSSAKNDLNSHNMDQIIMREFHLDKPIVVGFALWAMDALRGDFGVSMAFQPEVPVTKLILERLPATISLNFFAILVTYILSIPIGIQTAVRHDSVFDKSTTLFLFFLYSLPVIAVALLLKAVFCVGGLFPVFPLRGLKPDIPFGVSTWKIMWLTALHYVLPVFCLSYASFAGISRFTRAGMLDVIRQEYIRTARAKGLPEKDVIYVHAFRNALIIMITLFAGLLQIGRAHV